DFSAANDGPTVLIPSSYDTRAKSIIIEGVCRGVRSYVQASERGGRALHLRISPNTSLFQGTRGVFAAESVAQDATRIYLIDEHGFATSEVPPITVPHGTIEAVADNFPLLMVASRSAGTLEMNVFGPNGTLIASQGFGYGRIVAGPSPVNR